jgi:acetoin utilization deacetylase AcuC-like enzyme
MSAESFHAALLAAGAAVQAVNGIMEGKFKNAFAAVRPPGHHATADRPMGFCLVNNIAIAARHLVRHYGLKSVLIIDWDVHHGNGTQEIFYDDPSVIYISLHKKYHYPGTGWEEERGIGDAEGTKINFPIGPPFDPIHYQTAFHKALQHAESYEPQFILISCGFDAHENDPLGNLGLTSETYGQLTETLIEFARKFGHERICSVLEGGYDYEALAEAGTAHIGKLL